MKVANAAMQAFAPGDTAILAATTATARVQIPNHNGAGERQVRLYNAGSATVFVKIGGSTVNAAVTDYPIPAGYVEVISVPGTVPPADRYIAAIMASGSASLYVTTGDGL
jgi:2-methylaconitate cis-trans-isomerase PrpF